MEKERFVERVLAAQGIQNVLDVLIGSMADAIGRLEKRIELLEDKV